MPPSTMLSFHGLLDMKILPCCLAAIGLATTLSAVGRPVPVPSAPPPVFADTESVTNAPLGNALSDTRFLRVEIGLSASPSNAVEVAFGSDEDGGGTLAFGSEEFSIGWDCGTWFFSSPTNRIEGPLLEGTGVRSLFLEIRVSESGDPRSWIVVSADGAFTNLPARPPEWTFSRNWTTVRRSVRGVDERDETVSVRLDTDPVVLFLR